MANTLGTTPRGKREARARLATARAYLEVASVVLDEQSRDEFLDVAAGLAVLAGIAASDAIGCVPCVAATEVTTIGRRPISQDSRS